jgi:sensor c-di-GMP phosphodiesterase-like protein
MGCTSGQGWYFGKPMPAEDATHLLRHSRAGARPPVPALPVARQA